MTKPMERAFYLKYRYERGVFTQSTITENEGLTDKAVTLSILQHEDGAQSQQIWNCDGFTGLGLTGTQLFKAWWLMGANLAMDQTNNIEQHLREFLDTCAQEAAKIVCAQEELDEKRAHQGVVH